MTDLHQVEKSDEKFQLNKNSEIIDDVINNI